MRSPEAIPVTGSRILRTSSRARLFTDFYDSVLQRYYPELAKITGDAKTRYLGRLRLDVLLSRTLVLTDAQLLDGAFFHEMKPADLLGTLRRKGGEDQPLEIRARAKDLSETILAFVKRPNERKLRGFVFSAIRDGEQRAEARKVLEATDGSKVSSWKKIPFLLRKEARVNPEDVERMGDAWALWIEAEEKGLIRVRKWETKVFDFGKTLDHVLGDPKVMARTLRTDRGRELAQNTYGRRMDRSGIDSELFSRGADLRGSELKDFLSIATWYHRAYNCTISMHHRCDNFETVYPLGSQPKKPQRLSDQSYGFPPHFLLGLGAMPGWMYQGLWKDHGHGFERWWRNGDLDAMRRSVEAYVKMATEDNHPSQFWTKAGRSVISAAGTNIFLGGILGPAAIPIGVLLAGAVEYIYHQDFNSTIKVTQRIVRTAERRRNP